MKKLPDLDVPPRHGRRRPKKRIIKTLQMSTFVKLLKYNCELCKIQSMVARKQPGAINVVRFQNSLS